MTCPLITRPGKVASSVAPHIQDANVTANWASPPSSSGGLCSAGWSMPHAAGLRAELTARQLVGCSVGRTTGGGGAGGDRGLGGGGSGGNGGVQKLHVAAQPLATCLQWPNDLR